MKKIYFALILQLINFMLSIAAYFIKRNPVMLVVAAIIPFSTLATIYYQKGIKKSYNNKDNK